MVDAARHESGRFILTGSSSPDLIVKGVQATGVTRWDYYHFRTRNGAEVDLVLEGSFGLLPIEIKFGRRTGPKQLEGLRRFIARHDLPFGIVVNNGDHVEMLGDTIVQIPAGCL